MRAQHQGIHKRALWDVTRHTIYGSPIGYSEIGDIVDNVNSLEELVQEIIRIEDEHFRAAEKPKWLRQAEKILEKEYLATIGPALDLAKAVEKHYFQLRRRNPNQDGHWLLANT